MINQPFVLSVLASSCALIAAMLAVRSLVFSDGGERIGGDQFWVLLTASPTIFCGLFCIFVLIVTILQKQTIIYTKRYFYLSWRLLITAYISVLLPNVFREVRLARFQRKGFEHIHWEINHGRLLLDRACKDQDPVRSWTFQKDDSGVVGCESRTLSARCLVFCILLTMCPIFLEFEPKRTLQLSFVQAALLSVSSLSIGCPWASILVVVVFQLSVGLVASYICQCQNAASIRQSILSAETQKAWEDNRKLLNSLIPENILEKVESSASGEIKPALIPRCSLMFCMLERREELQNQSSEHIFSLLSAVFCDFDDEVSRFGMYKYQHGACIMDCTFVRLTASGEYS